MIESLHGRFRLDVVVIVVECNRALGLPGDRLGPLELLFAAERLDSLVEDGVEVLVLSPHCAAQAGHEDGHERRTKKLPHGIASMVRGSGPTRTTRVPA